MFSTIKSDFRKLFTVRSTYFLTAIAILLTGGVSLYFQGYKADAADLTPAAIQGVIAMSATIAAIFIGIIAILFMAHEYRYNTIMYTMTANASRTKVLLSKLVTISIFSAIAGLVISFVAAGCYVLGVNLQGATLPTQNFDVLSQVGRIAAYFVGYGLVGVLATSLIRNLVGAIVFFFIVPSSLEPLIGNLILKGDKAEYLPFHSLDSIILTGSGSMGTTAAKLTVNDSLLLTALYLFITIVVAWALFLKRDVN